MSNYNAALFDGFIKIMSLQDQRALLRFALELIETQLQPQAADVILLNRSKDIILARAGKSHNDLDEILKSIIPKVFANQAPQKSNGSQTTLVAPIGQMGIVVAQGYKLDQTSLEILTMIGRTLETRLQQLSTLTPAPANLSKLSGELYGQQAAQITLTRIAEQAFQDRTPRGVALVGGEGSGKTSLLEWLEKQTNAQSIWAHGTHPRRTYGIWKQILLNLFPELHDLPPHISAYDMFLSKLNPDWGIRAGLLMDIIHMRHIDDHRLQSLSLSQRQEATLHMLAGLLVYAAERKPLLVVIDNAYLADEASTWMLHRILTIINRLSVPLLFAITIQPKTDVPDEFVKVEIKPLSTEHIVQLLSLVSESPPIKADLITTYARGNPLHIFLMLATRAVVRDQSKIIQEFFQQQLDYVQQIIYAAAAVGNMFELSPLATLLNHSVEQVTAILDQYPQFFRRIDSNHYSFTQYTYWKQARIMCPPIIWEQHHATLAKYYERNTYIDTERIAYHFLQSSPPAACKYLTQAAQIVHRRGALNDALAYITRAIAVGESLGNMERFAVYIEQSDLFHALGRYKDEDITLQNISDIIVRLDDSWLYAESGWRWLRHYRVTGQTTEGLATWRIFSHHAKQAKHAVAQVEITISAALLYRQIKDYPATQEQLDSAARFASDTRNIRLGARILYTLGEVFMQSFSMDLAQACFEQSIALYTTQDDLVGIAKSYERLGTVYDMLSYYNISDTYLQKGQAFWQQLGNIEIVIDIVVRRIELYLHQEKYEDASALIQGTEPLVQRLTEPELLGRWYAQRAQVSQMLGSYENSMTDYQKALDLLPEAANMDRVMVYARMIYTAHLANHIAERNHFMDMLWDIAPDLIDGGNYPAQVYQMLYNSLDNRQLALRILQYGRNLTVSQANTILDNHLRQRYLAHPNRNALLELA